MKLCGFVYVLMTCLLCAAQKVDTFSDCQKRANSQHDLQACADHEFRRVDADMTQNYQQLLAKAQGDAVAERKIRAAQQSWLSFRDAQLEAMYPHADKPGEYGSSYPTCALLLKTELTRQRAIMLSRMLSPVEGEVCDAGLRYRAANLNENSPVPMVATPATYAGDFPCADCEGTRFTVTLRSDGIFISRRTYLGAAEGKDESIYDLGRWSLEARGTRLVLRGGKEAPEQFAVNDENTLHQLDNEGGEIVSQQDKDLKRSAEIDPIGDTFGMQGEFVFLADAGVFTECVTGASFPLAQEKDNSALERAYASSGADGGTPLLVTLEGRLTKRITESGAEKDTIVVEHFDRVWPKRRCPSRSPGAK